MMSAVIWIPADSHIHLVLPLDKDYLPVDTVPQLMAVLATSIL